MTVLMKCGHAANAKNTKTGKPCCVICFGIVAGADEPMERDPDLTGRVAHCSDCKREVPSSTDLAFFSYQPGNRCDYYYCGCKGWN